MVTANSVLILAGALVSSGVFAHADHHKHEAVRPWQPAGPTDSRSPCPMMNTLANHGYIAHDGRGISAENIADGLLEALHFDRDSGLSTAQATFEVIGIGPIVDLEDLNGPGFEHNASLTREDRAFGDSLRLSPPRLQALLADNDKEYLDINSLAKSRSRVEALSPPLDDFSKTTSLGEAGFILMTMSEKTVPSKGEVKDYRNLRASKARVAMWLSNERLPVELGWHRPLVPLFNTTVLLIGDAIHEAQEKLEKNAFKVSYEEVPLQTEL